MTQIMQVIRTLDMPRNRGLYPECDAVGSDEIVKQGTGKRIDKWRMMHDGSTQTVRNAKFCCCQECSPQLWPDNRVLLWYSKVVGSVLHMAVEWDSSQGTSVW